MVRILYFIFSFWTFDNFFSIVNFLLLDDLFTLFHMILICFLIFLLGGNLNLLLMVNLFMLVLHLFLRLWILVYLWAMFLLIHLLYILLLLRQGIILILWPKDKTFTALIWLSYNKRRIWHIYRYCLENNIFLVEIIILLFHLLLLRISIHWWYLLAHYLNKFLISWLIKYTIT